jgi:arabinogalactan endo-1,4-beta-galactosidase
MVSVGRYRKLLFSEVFLFLNAFRGNQSINGSPWENQSLWDFNNRALPAMAAFAEKRKTKRP